MMPAAEVIPLRPAGAKSERLSESQPVIPTTMKRISTPSLISTMIALTLADSLAPRSRSSAQSPIRITAGTLKHAALLRRLRQGLGDREAEEVVQQLVEVLRPADGDGGGRDAVLEQQAGGDDDRDALAERRVGVGVGRARDRHGAGQLGVADGREPGDRAGQHEGQDDRGAADRHRLGEDDEDAGADRGADAEQRQLEQPDAALQLARVLRPSRSPPSSPRRACVAGPAPSRDAIAPLLAATPCRGRAGPPTSRGAPPPALRRLSRTPPGCGGSRCSCSPS